MTFENVMGQKEIQLIFNIILFSQYIIKSSAENVLKVNFIINIIIIMLNVNYHKIVHLFYKVVCLLTTNVSKVTDVGYYLEIKSVLLVLV